jgi:hypothetical protein
MADNEIIQDEVTKIVGGIHQDLPGHSFETGQAAAEACKTIVDEVFNFEALQPDKQLQNNFLHTLWHDMGTKFPLMAQTCSIDVGVQQVAKDIEGLYNGTGNIGKLTEGKTLIEKVDLTLAYRDKVVGEADRRLPQIRSAAFVKDLEFALDNLSPQIRNNLNMIDGAVSKFEAEQQMYEPGGTLYKTAEKIKSAFDNNPKKALVLYDVAIGGYIWRHQEDETAQGAFKQSLNRVLGPIADQLLQSQFKPESK